MILDRYIYPLDKIYSEAVGVLYPVCGAQDDVPPTPPTPEPQELLDFYWGVWADDEEHLNYFSTTLSFSDTEINLSELPEGWYGKAITDYGEVVVNANDILFGNALDIPNDDSDLTNLVNYTGEDQTLATTFEIYDANDNMLYYITSTDVEIVRTEVNPYGDLIINAHPGEYICSGYDFYAKMQCNQSMNDNYYYQFTKNNVFDLILEVDSVDNTKLVMRCSYDGQMLEGSMVDPGETGVCTLTLLDKNTWTTVEEVGEINWVDIEE